MYVYFTPYTLALASIRVGIIEPMLFLENADLSEHSTMRLGGLAKYLCTVTSEDELLEAIRFATDNNLKTRMIGSGSNIIWNDEGFDGLIIVNNLQHFEVVDTYVIIGSGVNWDEAVRKTVEAGLSGIEFLSLIPGTTGATPVQNVGAYGKEIKDTLISLKAYDTVENKFLEISNQDCGFGYRTSRFKTTDSGRFLITEIKLKLRRENPKPPFYDSLQRYLDENKISEYTPSSIREAVIAIRSSKLPDPDVIANNGSFFANPVVSNEIYNNLFIEFPEIKAWDFEGNKKIAAGWLVETAGFSDKHDDKTGMATWGNQSLVIVNEHAVHTSDLIEFRDQIINAVFEKFGIKLDQEPELI
jgi:UDP-N-acetylmuramate dehydrogenase